MYMYGYMYRYTVLMYVLERDISCVFVSTRQMFSTGSSLPCTVIPRLLHPCPVFHVG